MMNDLDICKRMGEIEGVELLGPNKLNYKPANKRCVELYNPLTDDALCFQLMIKYRIDFSTLECSGKHYVSWALGGNLIDENPNKAICLAIIESKAK